MIGLLAVNNLLDGPLFALGVEDVITIVIFLVVAIISVISQYFNKQKEKAARERRLEEQGKRRAAMAELEPEEQTDRAQEVQRPFGRMPEGPKPAAAPVDEDVTVEIRDFLERAATGRAPAGPKSVPPAVVVPMEKKHTSLADRRQAEARQSQVQAAQTIPKSGSKFDRKLGSLKQQSRSQTSGQPTTLTSETMATDIAAMFASTENIRQAIVINEILTRPVHRWESM